MVSRHFPFWSNRPVLLLNVTSTPEIKMSPSSPHQYCRMYFQNEEVLLDRTKALLIGAVKKKSCLIESWTYSAWFQWFMGFRLTMNLSVVVFESWIALFGHCTNLLHFLIFLQFDNVNYKHSHSLKMQKCKPSLQVS